MKTLIVNNHTKHIQELSSLFPNSSIIKKEDLKNTNITDYDLVVISGGSNVPTVLRHPEQYINEILLIKNTNIPILGICLGSELITYTYGGELKELPEEHNGEVIIKIKDLSLLNTIGTLEFYAQEGHRIGVKTLPKNFISCAYSDHGIEIFKHTSKPIIGLQFHPEIQRSAEMMNWVFNTFKLV